VGKEFKRYMITAALPYANGPLHIGHIAGAYLPPDIYVRYLRLKGKDVVFVCGSDEHGAAITLRAQKEGTTPQKIVDEYHAINEKGFKDFGIEFDIYHRTSSELHHKTASDFFKKLHDNDVLTQNETEQFYDEENKQFLADRYITGECPHCHYDSAYGDQCEKCGTSLSPKDLINPKSSLSGLTPIRKKTTHWYIPLNKYEDWLKEWILDGHKNDWKPNVYGQCKSWIVDQGLQPRAVTRDLAWGIPVPLEGAEGKVLYVWLDAPIGYISATKALTEKWKDYWQDEESKLVHFIGKDNIVFHCIIFPIMLKAHGEYILPDNVPSNEFMNLEGEKISTSRNWAIWLHEYLAENPGKEDVLRYVLCANAPESKDSEFTWKDYQARNNNELVAILGNFVNRSLVLTSKYFENTVPKLGPLNEFDKQTLVDLQSYPDKIGTSIEKYKFREALSELMNLARLGNKYLADSEPWKEIKDNPEHVATVLNISLQISSALAILMEPFLPFTSKKLKTILKIKDTNWESAKNDHILSAGNQLEKSELLFSKIEDGFVQEQVEKLKKSMTQSQVSENGQAKSHINFEDFSKLDIRIGTILAAERVPKTDKLLKLQVDTGKETRTIVSGIAEYYEPESIIGQQVSVLTNLEPRKIKGIESEGMILMAENESGELAFVSPEKEIEKGSVVR